MGTQEKVESEILLTLVQGGEGKAWASDQDGWKLESKYHVCYWEGVTCDDEEKRIVTSIVLPKEGLHTTIPSELGQLTALRVLSLPQNMIYGTLPDAVANLPKLEIINLSQNNLSGRIPRFKSPSLIVLSLEHNQLTGSLPSDIGEWGGQIHEFEVRGNNLVGPIPASFSSMDELQMLSLSENGLSGTIPAKLGSMKKLIYLYLNDNFLMGTIPSTMAGEKSPLLELWLQENMLSGTVPAAMAEVEDLGDFFIDGNKLTGTIPQELCREDLNADFYENEPESWDRDYCDSIACPVGHYSEEGVFPCIECPESSNEPYLGKVGECFDHSQTDIMELLNVGQEKNLWARGEFCSYVGIHCDKKENVVGINLKGAGLVGTIPPEVGFLQYLKNLDLSDNLFTGFVPSDLRFAPIEDLDLSGNRLLGMVPELLCLTPGINEGGQADYSCKRILCPSGTFSSTGRGQAGKQCSPCASSMHLGSKECVPTDEMSLENQVNHSQIHPAFFLLSFFVVILGAAFCIFVSYVVHVRMMTLSRASHSQIPDDDNSVDDWMDVSIEREKMHIEMHQRDDKDGEDDQNSQIMIFT